MYIESSITIINYDLKTFIVQVTMATIVNYDRNVFVAQATGRPNVIFVVEMVDFHKGYFASLLLKF